MRDWLDKVRDANLYLPFNIRWDATREEITAATNQDIKKAYRSIAHKYHPDKNPGDKEAAEQFRKAAEAWEILSNPEKRKRYDSEVMPKFYPSNRVKQQSFADASSRIKGFDFKSYDEIIDTLSNSLRQFGIVINAIDDTTNRPTYYFKPKNEQNAMEAQKVFSAHNVRLSILHSKEHGILLQPAFGDIRALVVLKDLMQRGQYSYSKERDDR